jgi:hypothetical protein
MLLLQSHPDPEEAVAPEVSRWQKSINDWLFGTGINLHCHRCHLKRQTPDRCRTRREEAWFDRCWPTARGGVLAPETRALQAKRERRQAQESRLFQGIAEQGFE